MINSKLISFYFCSSVVYMININMNKFFVFIFNPSTKYYIARAKCNTTVNMKNSSFESSKSSKEFFLFFKKRFKLKFLFLFFQVACINFY